MFVHTSGCQQHYLTLGDLSVFVPKSLLLYGIIIACTNQLQVLHIIFPLKGVYELIECMNNYKVIVLCYGRLFSSPTSRVILVARFF